MKTIVWFMMLVFSLAENLQAQFIKESKVSLQINTKEKKISEAENFYAILTFSNSTGQLNLSLNLSDFTFIDYTKDSIFNTYIGKKLTFKAVLPGNLFDLYKEINDGKEYPLT